MSKEHEQTTEKHELKAGSKLVFTLTDNNTGKVALKEEHEVVEVPKQKQSDVGVRSGTPNAMKSISKLAISLLAAFLGTATIANAGPIFLTGHDPDFHAQDDAGAENLLRIGLQYAAGGQALDPTTKFLWVESNAGVPGGHRFGRNALTGALGLTLGTHFDHVDAAGLAGVNFASYEAIAIASNFGGTLRRAELDGLIARSGDIATFINAGGGLFASSECDNCGADLLGASPDLFGFLPVNVTSIGANAPFTATAFGLGLGLVNSDLNSPTHNSFGAVGGLNIVDTDASGNATTLAGVVTVGGGGFNVVPEPATLALMGLGLAGLGYRKKKKLNN